MKCDKLESKDYNNGMTVYELLEENGLVNTAKVLKEAIAELKDKTESLENLAKSSSSDFACEYNELKFEIFKLQKENAELKADNERLNKELNEWVQSAANRPIVIGNLRKELAELREATRWRKFPDEKPNVKPGEAEDFLVVVDYYNTYDLKSTRGRYVTEAEYYVGETGCFYREYSDQEIDETFYGENGEECYEKVIMWRPLPKAPEVDK